MQAGVILRVLFYVICRNSGGKCLGSFDTTDTVRVVPGERAWKLPRNDQGKIEVWPARSRRDRRRWCSHSTGFWRGSPSREDGALNRSVLWQRCWRLRPSHTLSLQIILARDRDRISGKDDLKAMGFLRLPQPSSLPTQHFNQCHGGWGYVQDFSSFMVVDRRNSELLFKLVNLLIPSLLFFISNTVSSKPRSTSTTLSCGIIPLSSNITRI